MKRSSRYLPLVLALALGLGLGLGAPGAGQAADKPITLSFVSFVPLASKYHFQNMKEKFINKVNERAKGELVIKVRGGPEAIPPFDLGMAVQRGTVDMANVPTGFFEGLVPGIDCSRLSDYSVEEERANGTVAYLREMYAKAGIRYVGRAEATEKGFFYLFSNKKVEKREDFKGLKLGGSTAFHGFYENLGAGATKIALPEYHSALERGVVDGVFTSLSVGVQFGLHEVSKYIVGPGIYRSNVAMICNGKKWDAIPGHLQEIITQTMEEFENGFAVFDAEQKKKELSTAAAAGSTIITLAGGEKEWLLQAANEGAWKYASDTYGAAVIDPLRKMLTK